MITGRWPSAALANIQFDSKKVGPGWNFYGIRRKDHPLAPILQYAWNKRKRKISDEKFFSFSLTFAALIGIPVAINYNSTKRFGTINYLFAEDYEGKRGQVRFLLKKQERDWDGRTLYINHNKPKVMACDVIHECCHFIIADKELQKLPNWGLGIPGERGIDTPYIKDSERDSNEIRVEILEFLLKFYLREFENGLRVLNNDSILFMSSDGFHELRLMTREFDWLVKNKFIEQDGRPRFDLYRTYR